MSKFRNTVRPIGFNPKFSFSKRTFEEKEKLMHLATDWLASLGINYYNTRIGKYLRDIERLNKAHQSNSVQELLENGEFPELVNSLFEASELISIYEGLHPIAVGDLVQRLRAFIKGTEFTSSESLQSLSNKGRDVGFELFIASLFAKGGYQLDFGTEADLIALDDQNTFFIECKRPQFEHSVRSNVRSAAKQVSRRLANANSKEKCYGIVALSISKIINPNFNLLVASSEQSIDSRLNEESDRFLLQNQQHWRNFDQKNLLAILMLLQTPGVVENHNMVTTCNFLAANNIVASGKSGVDLLISVVTKLKSALFTE